MHARHFIAFLVPVSNTMWPHPSLVSHQSEIDAQHKQAELAKKVDTPLPDGWRKVESRSRPGEFVYENIYTEERQAWTPTEAASIECASRKIYIILMDV